MTLRAASRDYFPPGDIGKVFVRETCGRVVTTALRRIKTSGGKTLEANSVIL